MARSASTSRPGRHLTALGVITVLLFGGILASAQWSDGLLHPKLGLDLEGGYQIVLEPQTMGGAAKNPSADQLRQAVEIIRQRVDASGTSEAEVTTQGGRNIVVAIPGKRDPELEKRVKASSQMQFRPLLAAAPGSSTQPNTSPTATGAATPSPSPTGSAKVTPAATATAKGAGSPSPSTSSNGMALPKAVQQALNPRKAEATPTATITGEQGAAAQTPQLPETPTVKPSNASDENWITKGIYEEFAKLDCSTSDLLGGGRTPVEGEPTIACSRSGDEKYILGPSELNGDSIADASWGQETNAQGNTTGGWEVRLKFSSAGGKKFADISERLVSYGTGQVRNRFAIVLDGVVISAPSTNERIGGGEAQITGDFSQREVKELAQQIKFGALPVSFEVKTTESVSALLGKEQLNRGLLAGLIGLILVVIYSLMQYRALGFVTVASLVVVGAITYGLVTILGWSQGLRLTLPGVAGLIVAIGVTADSFIVYFERIRDEVRDGKSLAVGVETAWLRARRTIVASDTVNFLAAAVLYLLAVGGVRGFAFTLGLTTIVDLLIVFLFTKPVVTLLARTEFFGNGHTLSGFDAKHLGRSVAYAGRGRVRSGPAAASAGASSGQTIAQRRAAARAAAEGTQDTTDEAGRSAEAAGTGKDR